MLGDTISSLRMASSLVKHEFASGESIILTILIQNVALEQSISLTETNPLRDYGVSVTMKEPRRVTVELTESGRNTLASAQVRLFRRKRVNLGPVGV